MTTQEAKRIRGPKGHRPYFFEDPSVDKLVAMVMALAGEVAVLRDRLDTHERLAAAKGVYGPGDVEAYRAPPDIDAERTAWRLQYVSRVLDAAKDTTVSAEREMSTDGYEKVVKGLS